MTESFRPQYIKFLFLVKYNPFKFSYVHNIKFCHKNNKKIPTADISDEISTFTADISGKTGSVTADISDKTSLLTADISGKTSLATADISGKKRVLKCVAHI